MSMLNGKVFFEYLMQCQKEDKNPDEAISSQEMLANYDVELKIVPRWNSGVNGRREELIRTAIRERTAEMEADILAEIKEVLTSVTAKSVEESTKSGQIWDKLTNIRMDKELTPADMLKATLEAMDNG